MPRACSLLEPHRPVLSAINIRQSISACQYVFEITWGLRHWLDSGLLRHMLSDAPMKAGRSGAPTRAEKVYTELRSDILNGRIGPGERLPFAQLCERYQASTGVLREVLPRLVEQGLATSERQFGFRVIPVSEADLRHLTELRVTIESQALRQSVEHGE